MVVACEAPVKPAAPTLMVPAGCCEAPLKKKVAVEPLPATVAVALEVLQLASEKKVTPVIDVVRLTVVAEATAEVLPKASRVMMPTGAEQLPAETVCGLLVKASTLAVPG